MYLLFKQFLQSCKIRRSYYKKTICLILLVYLISGCSKMIVETDSFGSNQLEKLRLPVPSSFVVNSKSYHNEGDFKINVDRKKRNSVMSTMSGPNDPIMGTYKDGPGIIQPEKSPNSGTDYLYFYQKYKSRMFTISDQSMALNIFPGAILDGRSIEGVFNPKMLQGISANIRPVTISTSMPVSGSAVAKTSLPRPIAERALYNAALTDLENLNPQGIGAASLQLELDSFNVYEELKTLYGYNKGVDIFLVNTNTTKQGENHLINSTSALKLKFFQENFTIDLDVPNSYNELFDPTGLDMNSITGGVTPVYVKSVTYGRMGIMVIESSYSSAKLYSAVYKQLGILQNLIGIDRHLTDEEKTIINTATIKVKYTGIGSDADGTIKIDGLNGFIDVLTANKTYSKDSPGVPVAFQLAYLNDGHGIVDAPFQINYGPYDMPFAKIEYANYSDNQGVLPYFRDADMYISFYLDKFGKNVYYNVPDFVPFKYQKTVNSTHMQNWVQTYNTRTSTGEVFVKNGVSKYFIGNVRISYFVKYGSDANTSRDEYTYNLVPNGYFSIVN